MRIHVIICHVQKKKYSEYYGFASLFDVILRTLVRSSELSRKASVLTAFPPLWSVVRE